ncbi:MAG: hypothetical protein CSA96_00360 [Bacteroidetes bacterium]|nr:MAG: hypothetical protein CSA96_00360 [Bacteroidota bacterium]
MTDEPRYYYRLFGLGLASELEIPGLAACKPCVPELEIEYGKVKEKLDHPLSEGVLFESTHEEFLLRLPGVGKFLASEGKHISLEAEPGTSRDELLVFVLGSVLGAILHQRGFLPMHASAIQTGSGALLITGHSAAGKSTLAAALNKAGFPLVSDDLSAVSLDNRGRLIVHPGLPWMKLWKDSRDALYPGHSFKRVRPLLEKFNVPVSGKLRSTEVLPITRMLSLSTKNTPGIALSRIRGAMKFPLMREHIFRDQLLKGMGLQEHHFGLLARLAAQVELYTVERPSVPLETEALRDEVLQMIRQDS